jgi:L-ribulose-5-phosphate 3-epimerase UlaE
LIKLKKIKSKKFVYSFVQGRFSSETAGRFQYFPISAWQNEFKIANKLNFDHIEWIVSDFSNPIFNKIFSQLIKKKLNQNNLKISSISLDLIMDNPLHSMDKEQAEWLADNLKKAVKFFKIKRVSIPIEERCRFNNKDEKKLALNKLELIYSKLRKHCRVCIETDMSPSSLTNILKTKRFEFLGILLDLGNTRAHGFKIEDYFNLFPEKIYSIHIKYRETSFGTTKVISKNAFHELKYFMMNFKILKNLIDISFQTFKSKKNFLGDMKKSIKNFNNYVR